MIGCILTAISLHHLVPQRISEMTKEERRALEAREYCEIMFLGPSYVASQISTAILDEEAARIGLNMRSCKFARKGLRGYEMRRHIQRLMKHEWPKLKLLVIDTTLGQKIGFKEGNWFKPRMLEWHTWSAVPWLVDYYKRDKRSWLEKFPEVWSHFKHLVGNYMLVGRGCEVLDELKILNRVQEIASADPDPIVKITTSSKKETVETKKKHRASRKERAEERRKRRAAKRKIARAKKLGKRHPGYKRKLRRLKRRKVRIHRKKKIDRGRTLWSLELRDVVRAYGLEAYFLYAPVWKSLAPFEKRKGDKDPLILMDFNDPARYPKLYVESVRGRTQHIRGEGRIQYSKLLAQKLAKHLETP
ncbi:MAG: hypothetical protein GY847_39745 [Proteobacteria bacterium]|nr:hypothetical protein [Pseudomonadota bacterium]